MRMRSKAKLAGAALALSLLTLTGCVVVDTSATPVPNKVVATNAPATTAASTPETDASEPEAEPTASATATASATKAAATATDYFDIDSSATGYAVANPIAGGMAPDGFMFDPWMTQVIVDADGGYTQRDLSCEGEALNEATGVIESADDGGQQILWDAGVDPFPYNAESKTTSVQITSTKVEMNYQGTAVSDVDGEREAFSKLCADNGNKISEIFGTQTEGVEK